MANGTTEVAGPGIAYHGIALWLASLAPSPTDPAIETPEARTGPRSEQRSSRPPDTSSPVFLPLGEAHAWSQASVDLSVGWVGADQVEESKSQHPEAYWLLTGGPSGGRTTAE